LERTNWRQFINEDFSATIITIHVFEDSDSYQEEIVSQIYEIIETTEKPAGVQTRATGGQVLNYEFNKS
jgi:predicted RND superfamily exporter protein